MYSRHFPRLLHNLCLSLSSSWIRKDSKICWFVLLSESFFLQCSLHRKLLLLYHHIKHENNYRWFLVPNWLCRYDKTGSSIIPLAEICVYVYKVTILFHSEGIYLCPEDVLQFSNLEEVTLDCTFPSFLPICFSVYLYLKIQSRYMVHNRNLRLVEWGVLRVCYLLTRPHFFFALSLFFPHETRFGWYNMRTWRGFWTTWPS